jgi:hypothetical protein
MPLEWLVTIALAVVLFAGWLLWECAGVPAAERRDAIKVALGFAGGIAWKAAVVVAVLTSWAWLPPLYRALVV